MRRQAPNLLLAFVAALAGAGCGGEDAQTADDANIAETTELFGDDRVADKLRGRPEIVPGTYAEVEKVFGIGRQCASKESKEIYVVEESSTRFGGEQEMTDALMPRAVVTGCNLDRQNPDSAINSFGLMVALFSSPEWSTAGAGDPMVLSPVEIMALDMSTGLYNFYVLTSNGEGRPGSVERIQLRPDDTVVRYRQEGSRVVTEEVADRACHNCHANMGPLMNELTEPWTNWVSTHKQLPEAKLSGETRSIVNEAVSLDGSHDRSSFANDLEPTMRAAVRVWVDGLPNVPRSGFGQATLDGDQPDGLPGLMKSVFCETELNYASALETVPLELFFDPGAVAGKNLGSPSSYSIDVFPIQLPVRSEMDKRIEKFLIKQKFVSLKTSTAIRLIDDVNDVFSKARCDLYPKVIEGLPRTPAESDAHVRKIVLAHLDSGAVPAGPRADYIRALLDPAATSAAVKEAQVKYFQELDARYAEDTGKLQTEEGRVELKARVSARKAAAKQMFPGAKNPLPILDAEDDMGGMSGSGGAGGSGSGGTGGSGGAPAGCAHDECAEGEALEATCSPCAQEVCAQDDFCCTQSFDATCVGIAKTVAACGCQ